jgi:CHAT domain-containing protein
VQALLPPQTTLVAYWLGEQRTLAFVLTRDGASTVELPVGLAAITQHVRQLRSVLILAPPMQRAAQPPAAAWLYEQLIAPLRPHIQTEQLILVPHNVLHHLPFAALGSSPGPLLVDEFTLTILPSASTLRFLQHTPSPPPQARALVLANADYTLPSAAAEAEAIARLFDSTVLLGEQANEQALRAESVHATIVHFATHGTFIPDAPLDTYLTLAPAPPPASSATMRADPAAGSAERLTVAEVYGLNLTQSQLVVLSACETNLSHWTAGDEMVSLARAFFFAGAPTVVASLWRVPDEATRLLMSRFYTYLRAGDGKAEALRKAQLDTREQYPSPYYWAGFVLLGEGQGRLAAPLWWAPVPWWGWLGLLGLVAAAAGLWVLRGRRVPGRLAGHQPSG